MVATPDHRCSEPLDGGLSLLYRNGQTLTIGNQHHADFRSAMVAILALDEDELAPVAERIAAGLRHRVRVTCELDRGLWEWMRSPNGNGNGHSH